MLDVDATVVSAVLSDWRTAPVSDRLRAGLAVVEAVTARPAEPMGELVRNARAAGLSDAEIEDAANVAFHFNIINRAADAFDFQLPSSETLPKLARLLDKMKRVPRGRRAGQSWVRLPDGRLRPVEVEDGYETMVTVHGASSPADRRAAEAHAAHLRGALRDGTPPAPLLKYLQKVATSAYKVVDEDVAALRAAGWTDRGIFEITMTAALGASVVGLETLFQALHGA